MIKMYIRKYLLEQYMIIRFAYLHDTVDYLLSGINKYRNQLVIT